MENSNWFSLKRSAQFWALAGSMFAAGLVLLIPVIGYMTVPAWREGCPWGLYLLFAVCAAAGICMGAQMIFWNGVAVRGDQIRLRVDLECLYFESPPHTSVEAKNKVIELASIVNNYSGNMKVHIVPFTKLQETIYKNVPDTYMITIMRRMMYRIAEKIARRRNCKIIINGESIGQVASQTLTSMSVINSVTNMPVIRPVACFDKLEIIDIANKIGTYETSILPFEDCCTIFVPKHPVINPELDKCTEYEKLFDYESLIDDCIRNIETIKKLEKEDFSDLL